VGVIPAYVDFEPAFDTAATAHIIIIFIIMGMPRLEHKCFVNITNINTQSLWCGQYHLL